MVSDNLSFISYNVKGIQQTRKNNSLPNGFVFFIFILFYFILQGSHSSVDDEKQWSDNLKRNYFALMVQETLVVSRSLFLIQNF